jgi:hypothetical protein
MPRHTKNQAGASFERHLTLRSAAKTIASANKLTSVPDKPSSPPKPARHLIFRRQIGFEALLALALAGGVILWIFVGRNGSSATAPQVVPVKPVALSASGLRALSATVGQPIYWAGPRPHYLYELKRTGNGYVYIRYLPPGVEAGAPGNNYLVIATYPYRGAFAALEKLAGAQGIQVPGGGLALVDQKTHKSVHLAFPRVSYQVEVFASSPEKALALATSGQVRPA